LCGGGQAVIVVVGEEMRERKYWVMEWCKGNLTNLRRELHLGLAKKNPK
jgi:hypothetical protein